jgi:uncharacterized protein (DUF1778 family)
MSDDKRDALTCRIELRLSRNDKKLIESAAVRYAQNVSEFIRDTMIVTIYENLENDRRTIAAASNVRPPSA